MTVGDFLNQLDRVKATSRGWIARCPAHDDRNPSLSIKEGSDKRILLHCFAGCSVESICETVGLRIADLFPNNIIPSNRKRNPKRKPKWISWDRKAFQYQFHADGLWFRAQSVLEAAKDLDTSKWTEQDLDMAMDAVCKAREDLNRAEKLDDIAFGIRARGLRREGRHYARRSSAD